MDLKALPLIAVDKANTFKVSDEAIAFLQTVKKPIAVISIAGAYRSGKSFLMNRLLLGQFSGFETASTIHACTKGLWIWNHPIDITCDGVECALLVIDSEGLGDTKEDANHDTRIYMLAMLLSSMFIYNGKTAIDEQSLSTMYLMLELCKNLQLRSEERKDDGGDLANYFPSLLWVIRDFALKLEQEDGTEMSMNRYLANSLEDQKGSSNAVEQKNRTRRLIRHFFSERECFGLIRPTDDERALQNMTSDAQLRPEFLSQISELYELITKKIRPKGMHGRLLNGEMLASLTITYTTAINQGGVPNIESAWTNVCKTENQRLVEETEAQYESFLSSSSIDELYSEEELKSKHSAIKEQLLSAMKQQSVGSSEELEPFLKAAREKLKAKFKEISIRNERKVMNKCEALLKMFGEEATTKLKKGEYLHVTDFKKDLDAYLAEMRKKAPQSLPAELKIRELSEKLTLEATDYIHRIGETEKLNESRRLTESVSQLQVQLMQTKEELLHEKQYSQTRQQEIEKEYHTAKAQATSLNSRIEDLLRDRDRLEENSREQLLHLREDQKERLDELKQRYQESQQALGELNKNSGREIADLKRECMLSKQELEFRNKECEDLKRKRTELEEDARASRTEILRLKQALDALETENKRLKTDAVARTVRQEGVEAPVDWVSEKGQLKMEIERLKAHLADSKSVQDVLMVALQSRSSETPRNAEKALETATNLSAALERNEQRAIQLEQKVERLKRYQKMIKNCSTLQCKVCSKSFNSAVFGAHLTVCIRDSARAAVTTSQPFSINITQATVKEGSDQKSFTEYLINVSFRGKTWTVNRRYKLFSVLNDQLEQTFPTVELPEVSQMFRHQNISMVITNSRPKSIDERRKMLQTYLTQLAAIPAIRDSHVFTQFIGADLYFPEEYGSPSPIRGSEEETPPASYRYQQHSQSFTDQYTTRAYTGYEMSQSPGHSEDVEFG